MVTFRKRACCYQHKWTISAIQFSSNDCVNNYQCNRICSLNLFTLVKQCLMDYINKVITFEGFYSTFGLLGNSLRCSICQKLGAIKKFKSPCNIFGIHKNLCFFYLQAKFKHHFVVFHLCQYILNHLQCNSLSYDVCIILRIYFPFFQVNQSYLSRHIMQK